MAREGAFKELDISFGWHPMNHNEVRDSSMTAIETAKFHFKGITSHAAVALEEGRSALDAVELINVGANYLRQHVTDDVRFHYQIIDGGSAPNIVPGTAGVYYFVRSNKRTNTIDVFNRIVKCAEGAAPVTETSFELERLGGCYEIQNNDVVNEVVDQAMKEAKAPEYTDEEVEFADKLNSTLPTYERTVAPDDYQPISTAVKPMNKLNPDASTVVGDVTQMAQVFSLLQHVLLP